MEKNQTLKCLGEKVKSQKNTKSALSRVFRQTHSTAQAWQELSKHRFLGIDLRTGEIVVKYKPRAPESQICKFPDLQ